MRRQNPAKSYLLSLESHQSRVTMQSYILQALDILQPGSDLQSFDWPSLTHNSLNLLRTRLQEQGKAPATINTYLAAMKGVAKEAWRNKYIDVETYQHIKEVKRFKGTREPKGRALSIDELNIIIDYCMSQEGPIAMRDAALIALVYGAGLRRSEAANLKLSAYKAKQAEIKVLGKGNKERVNALNDRVVDILECWLDERGRQPGPLFVRIYKGGKVTNEPISGQTVYDIVMRRYKEAGLTRLTPHDLRKTYATNLLESGEDIFTVQDLMGHASVETTKKYDRRDEKNKRKAARALPL